MKFFVDTADKNKIMELISLGMVDGVTTNPSLIAKNGDDMVETITAICDIQNGPVSAEVTATDYDGMVEEGKYLAGLADNVVVKVPLTEEGLMACKTLRHMDINVNVTIKPTSSILKTQKTINNKFKKIFKKFKSLFISNLINLKFLILIILINLQKSIYPGIN